MIIVDSNQFDKEWAKEIEQYDETSRIVNKEISEHLKIFYNDEWKLNIHWFLINAKEVVNKLYLQSWENRTFSNIDKFMDFLTKVIKLHILFYNLNSYETKTIRENVFRFWVMYWEVLKYWEILTQNIKIYLSKNRNNEEEKEKIKQLVEKDYEIFFWESAKWRILSTKVWQATNEIIEVFSDLYYGSLDSKDTTK